MKSITLQAAYAKATSAPLEVVVETSGYARIWSKGQILINIESRLAGKDAALLVHAFNVLPEVVAALEEVLNTLSPHLDKRARATLTKANTVKIP